MQNIIHDINRYLCNLYSIYNQILILKGKLIETFKNTLLQLIYNTGNTANP